MNTYDSFPEFSTFPSEVRRLIWKCCLPRRIAEVDFPFTLLDGKDSRQACWPNRTTYQNARVPVIAAVCREAREVVSECGAHKETQDDTSLRSIWIQPKIDRALHLNWFVFSCRSVPIDLSQDSVFFDPRTFRVQLLKF